MAELDPDVKIAEINWMRANLPYAVGWLLVTLIGILISKGVIAFADVPATLRAKYLEFKRLFDKYTLEDF